MSFFDSNQHKRFCHDIKFRCLGGLLLFLILTTLGLAQQVDIVDFKQIRSRIEVFPEEGKVNGSLRVRFEVLRKTDSVYLDAVGMTILKNEDERMATVASENKIWFIKDFEAGEEYTAVFTYETIPKQTLYFTEDQIWTQGQGKYTSHWLPSIDDMNDKIEFVLSFIVPGRNWVVANGKLMDVEDLGGKIRMSYKMTQPMSSYLVAFANGNFNRTELTSASGIPIELYFRPEDSLKAEPTYRYTKEIFDFLETEIGVPYPWQNYKQVPVRDFLYAGMENTTATIFSEAFVVDSIGFNDRNYVNVNAHELAHQWFGNLVTETEGTHHWLHEGFATYYALLAEKEVFGDDYYYWKLLQSAEQLEELSREGKGQSLLDPKASSLTFYEKGAWALHLLKELIGAEAFQVAVKNYLVKHQFRNVTTTDFLNEVRAATLVDISKWEADWLRQTAFKASQAVESLRKSEFINDYFKAGALRNVPFENKKDDLAILLTLPNDYLGQEAVIQLTDEPIEKTLSLYKLAFESDNLLVRQAIVGAIQQVPSELKTEFESLLDDPSYFTKQFALSTLWYSFPEERLNYLEKTKYVEGFQNKNIKLLWLTLAISSEAYGASANEIFISELINYSDPAFSFEIRQQAMDYLLELKIMDDTVLKNLANASAHHNWRFRNHARKILEQLLELEVFRERLARLLEIIPEKDARYLRSKINTE
jgi:aminopeptidase N